MVLSRPRHKVRATTVVGEESTFAGAKVTRRVLAAEVGVPEVLVEEVLVEEVLVETVALILPPASGQRRCYRHAWSPAVGTKPQWRRRE